MRRVTPAKIRNPVPLDRPEKCENPPEIKVAHLVSPRHNNLQINKPRGPTTTRSITGIHQARAPKEKPEHPGHLSRRNPPRRIKSPSKWRQPLNHSCCCCRPARRAAGARNKGAPRLMRWRWGNASPLRPAARSALMYVMLSAARCGLTRQKRV